MAGGFTVDDRAFSAGVTDLMGRWRLNTRKGMNRFGEAAVEAMHRHIHDVSGELAHSLGIEDHTDENPPYIEVGAFEGASANPHGLYDEFGTSKMTARPFARPGLQEAERKFVVDP